MDHRKNKFGIIIPKKATKSYQNFASEIQHSELFMQIFLIGANYVNREDARKAMIEIHNDPKNEVSKELIDYFKSQASDEIFNILTYEQFYCQMCFARIVDNLLSYFKEILGEVIIKQPQILKSKETERLDFILDFDTIDELRIAIAEKKIEALFYAGFDTIESFFSDRLGLGMFKSKNEQLEFLQTIKSRNVIVHNRGRINKEYYKEFPDPELQEGDYLGFTYADISKMSGFLLNFVAELDHKIASKFSLNLEDND